MWAKALAPTYGCREYGGTFVISLTACAIRVASASRPAGSTGRPSLSSRFATMVSRSALPVRSPYPLRVPWTCTAPASTAASEFATAHPVSLWQWMPSAPWVASRTSWTTSAIATGSIPPLVSHRATTSAPSASAVRSTSTA